MELFTGNTSARSVNVLRPRDVPANLGALCIAAAMLTAEKQDKAMYVIRLRNCAFFARHGVFDEEEKLGQRFYVDAELFVEPETPLGDDSIENTVDYGVAFTLIEEVVTGGRRLLIETLALRIAQALCGRFPQIKRASITVRKPSAPVPGVLDHVEVSVDWPQ